MKCCQVPLDVRYLYRYHIATLHCNECKKIWDINIPRHIPAYQFEQYTKTKYHIIIKKEQILLNNIIKGIRKLNEL